MEEDILLLKGEAENQDYEDDPSPSDVNYFLQSQLRNSALNAVFLGIAVGFAWGIMFVIFSLVAGSNGSNVLDIFKSFYPYFEINSFSGILTGFAWSFLYGGIFGFLIGALYNAFLRQAFLSGEGFETYG